MNLNFDCNQLTTTIRLLALLTITMLIHHKRISLVLSLLLLLPILTLEYQPKDHYIINFGLPKSSTTPSSGSVIWSDEDFALTPLTTTTTITATSDGVLPPYDTARVFRAPLSYSIPVSSMGPKLVRLSFPSSTTTYNTIDIKNAFLSLTIDGFQILSNFSAYFVAANADAKPNTTAPTSSGLVREIYVTTMEEIHGKTALNLTFSPSQPNGFGFINRVEITSVPDGLYANRSSTNQVPYLTGGLRDYTNPYDFPSSLAMENIIRLNVGGSPQEPSQDTGIGRSWLNDQSYVLSSSDTQCLNSNGSYNIKYTASTPPYIAPISVYSTMRSMGSYYAYQKTNMTWGFEVDGGFTYLLRLHFCNLMPHYNKTDEVMFNIYINNEQATNDEIDVNELAGGLDIPIYRDFVTILSNTSTTDARAMLWVSLVPDENTRNDDAFLNGLEIFKLNSSIGSLAAPNPTLPQSMMPVNTPIPSKNSSKHKLPIIVGVIAGAILVSLSVCLMIVYRRKKEKQKFRETMSKEENSSKMKWVSPFYDSVSNATTTSVGSSLPSDLCRRFSFTQIKVASCDFDENSIIGTGGFGIVYKGSIDNGATTVAIKRLNSTSKQGAREFQTEIEMLSRLRHVNLVSLIGYCDEHGEMILVYEYMQRGTLRDHLLYKNPDENINATPLSWKQRLMICVGSARGLHYLHAGAKQLIIHRDVKSTNILLDDKWTAKVSDFGLSKIGAFSSEGGATHVSTAVKGSIGYLDPEYYRRQQLTEKSDVYSFGVLLFEVLCARPAMNPSLPKEQVNLSLWARSCYRSGILHTIVDQNIRDQIAPESLRKFGDIADACVRDRGAERPSMGDVVWSLEFVLQLQETAENNVSVENQGKLSSHTSFNHENSSTHDDASNTSGGNFSETSVVESDTKRLIESKTSTTMSSDYTIDDMKSGSVFSEIIDPKAR